ncbi:MAG: tetratricopeptide repeat protein, partial [Terracidiphilus sp.]
MKLPWKIAVIVLCVAAICGAAITWQVSKVRKANEQKLVEAARVCRASAEQGDAKAQSRLGYMYSHGQGVPQDYSEAFRWYSKAADQGEATGQSGLGYMYAHGESIPQDYTKALDLYLKAADQGNAMAQYVLGLMYYHGYGAPQDYAESARWYRKAADQGYTYALYNLGYMYKYGYGVPVDRAEADRWFHKAADQGDEYAQRALGIRVPAIKTYTKISLILSLLGGLILLSDYILPKKRLKKPRQVNTLLAGTLCLFYATWHIFGSSLIDLFHSTLAVCLFYFIDSLIGGVLSVLLFSIVIPKRSWLKSAKIGLGIFAALFLINNGILIFLYQKYHAVPGSCLIYKVNGMPIGASVLLVLYLLKPHT